MNLPCSLSSNLIQAKLRVVTKLTCGFQLYFFRERSQVARRVLKNEQTELETWLTIFEGMGAPLNKWYIDAEQESLQVGFHARVAFVTSVCVLARCDGTEIVSARFEGKWPNYGKSHTG